MIILGMELQCLATQNRILLRKNYIYILKRLMVPVVGHLILMIIIQMMTTPQKSIKNLKFQEEMMIECTG